MMIFTVCELYPNKSVTKISRLRKSLPDSTNSIYKWIWAGEPEKLPSDADSHPHSRRYFCDSRFPFLCSVCISENSPSEHGLFLNEEKRRSGKGGKQVVMHWDCGNVASSPGCLSLRLAEWMLTIRGCRSRPRARPNLKPERSGLLLVQAKMTCSGYSRLLKNVPFCFRKRSFNVGSLLLLRCVKMTDQVMENKDLKSFWTWMQ